MVALAVHCIFKTILLFRIFQASVVESEVIESTSVDGPIPIIDREAIEGKWFKLLSND